ncbi:hypothetical protein AB0A63_10660 [Lentzea sp. NPDC042327]|uniref:hypothetical protein n=1 Tax=Lentzea sp. NPDC042327 TaxID=3154801 RepID=UPI003406CD71
MRHASATGHDSTASVAAILAGNGVPLDAHHLSPVLIPRTRQAEPAEERWETEGGHLVTRKQPAENRTLFRVTIGGTSAADFAQQTRTLSPWRSATRNGIATSVLGVGSRVTG